MLYEARAEYIFFLQFYWRICKYNYYFSLKYTDYFKILEKIIVSKQKYAIHRNKMIYPFIYVMYIFIYLDLTFYTRIFVQPFYYLHYKIILQFHYWYSSSEISFMKHTLIVFIVLDIVISAYANNNQILTFTSLVCHNPWKILFVITQSDYFFV